MSEKYVLRLDSQQLTAFQRCEQLFKNDFVLNIDTKVKSDGLMKGSIISDCLQVYYQCKLEGKNFKECTSTAVSILMPQIHAQYVPEFTRIVGEDEFNKIQLYLKALDSDTQLLIIDKLSQYFNYYRQESWVPMGTEVGFSKIIYEDDDNLFLYEGKIDLLFKVPELDNLITFEDHKSQAFKYEINKFSNQFFGYAWAVGVNTGLINYIGLQKSKKPLECFRREIITYRQSLIDEWVKDTIQWFWRIKSSQQIGDYPKVRAACETKYGFCKFYKLCEQTNPNAIEQLIQMDYVTRPKWEAYKDSEHGKGLQVV